MRNVRRGGIGLPSLNSDIEYAAAAKGQDVRNKSITARNNYCNALLFVLEQMKKVGRWAISCQACRGDPGEGCRSLLNGVRDLATGH
jgi:hypothetical protein